MSLKNASFIGMRYSLADIVCCKTNLVPCIHHTNPKRLMKKNYSSNKIKQFEEILCRLMNHIKEELEGCSHVPVTKEDVLKQWKQYCSPSIIEINAHYLVS